MAIRGTIVLAMLVLALSSVAQTQTSSSAIGVWRGTSTCLVQPSACKNEIVVYRITRAAAKDSVAFGASRMMNGQEVDMGGLGCRIAPSGQQITCIIPSGVWQFRVRGDSLVGELKMPDSTKFRDVRAIRSR